MWRRLVSPNLKTLATSTSSSSSTLSRSIATPRCFATESGSSYNDGQGPNSPESADDFEKRIFSGGSEDSSFFKKLDRVEQARSSFLMDGNLYGGYNCGIAEGDDESSSTLTDGLDEKLKKAAEYFGEDEEVIMNDDDFTYRADMNFRWGGTYTPEDLNLRKPGVWKPNDPDEFEVTSEEVLKKADFRNVRFLANFLTEAGIIIKRSKTGISAKAQRKVAREIKTARAFGLLPFTTMGTKQFVFGQTMEDLDADYELDRYYSRADDDDAREPV